jgi:hypothetical protein
MVELCFKKLEATSLGSGVRPMRGVLSQNAMWKDIFHTTTDLTKKGRWQFGACLKQPSHIIYLYIYCCTLINVYLIDSSLFFFRFCFLKACIYCMFHVYCSQVYVHVFNSCELHLLSAFIDRCWTISSIATFVLAGKFDEPNANVLWQTCVFEKLSLVWQLILSFILQLLAKPSSNMPYSCL